VTYIRTCTVAQCGDKPGDLRGELLGLQSDRVSLSFFVGSGVLDLVHHEFRSLHIYMRINLYLCK